MANYPGNEPSKDGIGGGAAPSPCREKNHRRSDRVFLSLLIRVSGLAENGKDFFEEARTEEVSRHGAAIVVDRELAAGQNIKVQRVGIGKEAMARVVGRIFGRSEGRLFGLALLDPAANLWDISFPAALDLEKAVLRALLKCIACGRLEVCYLSEFDADIFLHHHCISRICGLCGGWTTWTRPFGLASPNLHVPVELDGQHQRPRHALAPGTQNLRSHDRIQVDAVGRVRHPTIGNEVVLVRDLARGGLSFYSASYYPEGSLVEMAVPYASKAPNIYSSARIVSSRKGAEKGLIEYGVAYLP
jgi:hypothetical protein